MTDELIDTRNIYERLEAARCNFPPIHRNAQGQVGPRRYAYADLNTVREAVVGPLREQGLALVESVGIGYLEVSLVITHGAYVDFEALKQQIGQPVEELTCVVELPTMKGDGSTSPQQLGSAITYARRYGLVALLGLVTEEDDDGAEASQRPSQAHRDGSGAAVRAAGQPATAPPTPVFDATANGWESDEICRAAHSRLRERITDLHPDLAAPCRAFREEHGWPLEERRFRELEEIVNVAERFGKP